MSKKTWHNCFQKLSCPKKTGHKSKTWRIFGRLFSGFLAAQKWLKNGLKMTQKQPKNSPKSNGNLNRISS